MVSFYMVKNRQRSEWYKFYQDRMNMHYRQHIEIRYADFINAIINQMPDLGKKPVHLHEAGCGAANISRALYKKLRAQKVNFHISMSDKCVDMLELAHENFAEGYKACIDMLKDTLPPAEVIFSHGVLEHFTNEEIVKIVSKQLQSSKKVIHYVPSDKYNKPSFGDERLMSAEQWQKICNPTSIIEFNDGYDLILIWDLDKIKYPSFIFLNDKIVRRIPARESHISYEGMSIPKTDGFFLSKGIFYYPDIRYKDGYAKEYRYPTPNEELIYGIEG